MLNKVILMGRFVKNPELKSTQTGKSVVSFTLAVDRDFKDANGDRQTDFINCVAWGKQAEFVSQWFDKGAMAIVDGRIQQRVWQDKDGNNRYAFEVICNTVSFGETKKAREANGQTAGTRNGGAASNPDFVDEDFDDSDLPF